MSKRAPLTKELVAEIASEIDAMPPKPASRSELDLLIAGIEKQIRSAQKRGITYTEIAEKVAASGYPITETALRTALQRRKKNGSPSVARKHNSPPRHDPTNAPGTTLPVENP